MVLTLWVVLRVSGVISLRVELKHENYHRIAPERLILTTFVKC